MSARSGWKRQGRGSGPANVYLDRYEVRRSPGGRWETFDRVRGRIVVKAPTMRDAKFWTEQHVWDLGR